MGKVSAIAGHVASLQSKEASMSRDTKDSFSEYGSLISNVLNKYSSMDADYNNTAAQVMAALQEVRGICLIFLVTNLGTFGVP